MGVDTQGLLNKEINVLEVKAVIEEMIQDEVKVKDNGQDFYTVSFEYKGEHRNMSLFENYASEVLDGEIKTIFTLGRFGYANEIIHSIVSYFGGLYIEDDCSDNEPLYLEKDGGYVENSSMKSDKELLKLMSEFDLPLNQKVNFIKFIKENKDKIIELVDNI